jgi:hypothetical protein
MKRLAFRSDFLSVYTELFYELQTLDNPLIAKCFTYDVMHIPLSIHILFQKLLNLNPGIIGIHDIVSPNVLGYSLSI